LPTSPRPAATTHCYNPQLPALRDPVVTCGGDRLRFESFSGCCGVYARLDVLSDALDGEVIDRGTTNVDAGGPLREALARVGGADPLRLTVGPDELAVTTLDRGAGSPGRARPCTRSPTTTPPPTPTWSERCCRSSPPSTSTGSPSAPGCRPPGCGPR